MFQEDNLERTKTNFRKAARRKDEVWKYFEEKGKRNQGHCGAICTFCNWKKTTV